MTTSPEPIEQRGEPSADTPSRGRRPASFDPAIDHDALLMLLDNAPDVVVVADADEIIRYVTPNVTSVFGYDPAELLGSSYEVLLPIAERASHRNRHHAYMDAPRSRPMGFGLVLRAPHRDGHEVPVEIALVPMHGRERLVAAIIRDVTATHQLIERLAATGDLLAIALGGAGVGDIQAHAVELGRLVVGAGSCVLALAGDDSASGHGTHVVVARSVDPSVHAAIEAPELGAAVRDPLSGRTYTFFSKPGDELHAISEPRMKRTTLKAICSRVALSTA